MALIVGEAYWANTARVSSDGYLMVCLCDVDGTGKVAGPILTDAEICSGHGAIKLETLVNLGVSCLLFTTIDDEIVPLRKDEHETG